MRRRITVTVTFAAILVLCFLIIPGMIGTNMAYADSIGGEPPLVIPPPPPSPADSTQLSSQVTTTDSTLSASATWLILDELLVAVLLVF